MSYLETAAKLIQQFEGCELVPYEDVAGKWTVGWGHLCLPDDALNPITQEQADELFAADLAKTDAAVRELVTVPLTDNERAALLSFTFNLGSGNLAKSTLLKRVNEGNPRLAAVEFPRWSYAGGQRVDGLLRRRYAEQALFLKP